MSELPLCRRSAWELSRLHWSKYCRRTAWSCAVARNMGGNWLTRCWCAERFFWLKIMPPTALVLHGYMLHRLRPGCSTFGLKGLVCKQDWKQQDALDMQKAWRQEYVEEERKD